MTCRHVLGLIDAGPFADYPSAHRDAAWAHARDCATCGPALAASQTLTRALKALPHVTPSRDLTDGVLARITPLEMPLEHAAIPDAAGSPEAARDSWEWASHAAAIAATVAAAALISSGAIPIPESASGDALMGSLIDVPPIADGSLALAACLALYGFGLFTAGRERGSV